MGRLQQRCKSRSEIGLGTEQLASPKRTLPGGGCICGNCGCEGTTHREISEFAGIVDGTPRFVSTGRAPGGRGPRSQRDVPLQFGVGRQAFHLSAVCSAELEPAGGPTSLQTARYFPWPARTGGVSHQPITIDCATRLLVCSQRRQICPGLPRQFAHYCRVIADRSQSARVSMMSQATQQEATQRPVRSLRSHPIPEFRSDPVWRAKSSVVRCQVSDSFVMHRSFRRSIGLCVNAHLRGVDVQAAPGGCFALLLERSSPVAD